MWVIPCQINTALDKTSLILSKVCNMIVNVARKKKKFFFWSIGFENTDFWSVQF